MGIATPSHSQAIRPIPPTPIDVKKGELGGTPWNPQWDEIIEEALPPEMLSSQVPRGVRRFCPRFYEMGATDKRTFWAYFFRGLTPIAIALLFIGYPPSHRLRSPKVVLVLKRLICRVPSVQP
jgi:hypothetical protein